jgi:FAD/FMN-containing dehydrogenase
LVCIESLYIVSLILPFFLGVIQHYGNINATVPVVDLNFVDGLNSAITNATNATFGAYLNYIDPTLTRDEAKELYYGEALYSNLSMLKSKYDPKNTFWNPLSIEPFHPDSAS